MKFIPIINLNLGTGNLSYDDTRYLYSIILEVFQEANIDKVEFSFASSDIFDNLDLILNSELYSDDKICFGSLISVEILQRILPLLQESIQQKKDLKKLEIYAPAFDNEIYEYIQANALDQVIDYIPGIGSVEDFEELISKKFTPGKIKIFPINNANELLRILQAPYPELKSGDLQKRIHNPGPELAFQYDLYEQYKNNDSIFLINSPRDYQKIRKQFLVDKSKRLLFKANDINLENLVQELKTKAPEQSLIITGFNRSLIDYEYLDRLAVDFIATRVFRNIILDLLAGNISLAVIKHLMLDELRNLTTTYEKKFH